MPDIAAEIEALNRLSTNELAERYAALHGRPCRTRHRAYLVRKIIWRIQANAEGDLVERAKRLRARAAELADDAEVRLTAPKTMLCPPEVGEAVRTLSKGCDPKFRRGRTRHHNHLLVTPRGPLH